MTLDGLLGGRDPAPGDKPKGDGIGITAGGFKKLFWRFDFERG